MQNSESELRRQCATIHKTDDFYKEPAQNSENELRRQCATIHKTDDFCKEPEQKAEATDQRKAHQCVLGVSQTHGTHAHVCCSHAKEAALKTKRDSTLSNFEPL